MSRAQELIDIATERVEELGEHLIQEQRRADACDALLRDIRDALASEPEGARLNRINALLLRSPLGR